MISASSLSAFSAGTAAGSIRSQTATAASTATAATGRIADTARSRTGGAQQASAVPELPQQKPSQALPRGSLLNLQA